MIYLIEDSENSVLSRMLKSVQADMVFECSGGNAALLPKAREIAASRPDILVVVPDLCAGNLATHKVYRDLVNAGFTVAPIVGAEHCALSAFKYIKPVRVDLDKFKQVYVKNTSYEGDCKLYYNEEFRVKVGDNKYACGIDIGKCCGDHGVRTYSEKARMFRACYPDPSNIIQAANRYVSFINSLLPKGYQMLPLQNERVYNSISYVMQQMRECDVECSEQKVREVLTELELITASELEILRKWKEVVDRLSPI